MCALVALALEAEDGGNATRLVQKPQHRQKRQPARQRPEIIGAAERCLEQNRRRLPETTVLAMDGGEKSPALVGTTVVKVPVEGLAMLVKPPVAPGAEVEAGRCDEVPVSAVEGTKAEAGPVVLLEAEAETVRA
uniref:Uncharacterized protein n=1 Tax=Myotis myotis TaxID=51298 RepID=A0A7J7RKA2_MYOMY|nr:hypothetical protein mMyoMyo1_010291 [Myotis myotis]